ncbi:MAG: hypothetical protein LBL99_02050 [Holosporaceae bacterium]|jgi:hypothetical protein|nr:hypothetical protein [Holosporaceae bacterium]
MNRKNVFAILFLIFDGCDCMTPFYLTAPQASAAAVSIDERKPHRFTGEEDDRLIATVEELGEGNWGKVARRFLRRSRSQLKQRWDRVLNPKINRDPWTAEEDADIFRYYETLGCEWTEIARLMGTNRTDAQVRYRFSVLNKRATTAAAIAETAVEIEGIDELEFATAGAFDGDHTNCEDCFWEEWDRENVEATQEDW